MLPVAVVEAAGLLDSRGVEEAKEADTGSSSRTPKSEPNFRAELSGGRLSGLSGCMFDETLLLLLVCGVPKKLYFGRRCC